MQSTAKNLIKNQQFVQKLASLQKFSATSAVPMTPSEITIGQSVQDLQFLNEISKVKVERLQNRFPSLADVNREFEKKQKKRDDEASLRAKYSEFSNITIMCDGIPYTWYMPTD